MKESASRDDFAIAIRSAFLKKENKQKFSLFALIILSILLIVFETIKLKPLNLLRSGLKDGIYRASLAANYPIKFISKSSLSISRHLNTYSENIKLREELEKFKSLAYESEYLKIENKTLKIALEEKQEFIYDSITAKVILDKNSPYLKSIILNKGRNDKILKGMPVLSGSYLIGKIVESNFFSSRVLLLSDLNSKIPIIVEPLGYHAILSGKGNESPVLEFLPKNHQVSVGNTVFTSGKDGVLSSGINLGKTILADDGTIQVELFSDPNQINYANIILGKIFN